MFRPSLRSRRSTIEPLEARIAPALLINGANLLGGSSPNTGESSAGGNSVTLVKVLSGQAIVWYSDGDILGISVGPNASLEIHGNVSGDIVANLRADGRLSDSDNDPLNGEDGEVLLPNNILGIKTLPLSSQSGDIGNIITGGAITNVNVHGSLNGLFAGDGAFNSASRLVHNGIVDSSLGGAAGLDFNPIESGTQSVFHLDQAASQVIDAAHNRPGMLPGASVINATIGKAVELQAIAGSGNPNSSGPLAKPVAGGAVRNITIASAFSHATGPADTAPASYQLVAGDGSSGPTGGAGGAVDHIFETTSAGKVIMTAGRGGAGTSGPGGAGGSITYVDAGSDSARYTLTAGDGGSGISGGAGGSLTNNNFANRSPIGGVLVSGDFDGDGADDVVIINQGTGEMVLEHNKGGIGTTFEPVTQHTDTDGTPITIIAAVGDTPIDAAAADVNGDGKLDLVVAYKNSNQLGVYLNKGGGVFWDPSIGDNGGFDDFSVALSFSPSKISLLDASGSRIALAENSADGKSALHLAARVPGQDQAFTYQQDTGVNKLTLPIADLVTLNDGSLVVATVDGKLDVATLSGIENAPPFDITETGRSLQGGITDLDVDSDGTRVLALSTTGHTLATFEYDPTNLSSPLVLSASITNISGKQLVAHFISDGVDHTPDQIAILSGLTATSRVDLYSPVVNDPNVAPASYSLAKALAETQPLKNFAPVYSLNNDAGFAALSSTLSQFTFSDGFVGGTDYTLPFASKRLDAHAGHGGAGIDLLVGNATKSGRGGAGGSISGLNVEANQVILVSGDGGDTQTNAGGAGGSISNPGSFTTASGALVKPALHADELLSLTTGNGGSPATAAKSASGGAGGSLSNLSIDLGTGDLLLTSGKGGDSRGGAAGNGGDISGITSLLHDGSLTVTAGNGGNAAAGPVVNGVAISGAGGRGGSVLALQHELALAGEVESLEKSYFVKINAGIGGSSVTSAGGDGGDTNNITLKLDEANVNAGSGKDSTVTVTVAAGDAGSGAKGGAGGGILGLKFDAVLDQITPSGLVIWGGAVMGLTAGHGGDGSNGAGGNGGSIALGSPVSGLSFVDLDATSAGPTNGLGLLVKAGDGGSGSTKGGFGGDVSNLIAQNQTFVDGSVITNTQLTSASITAGSGGNGGLSDGGRGGNIAGALLGVQGGYLDVMAGAGGDGGTAGGVAAKSAKGGIGGIVSNGEFGLVSTTSDIGMWIAGGAGGDGVALGGAGGGVLGLKLNASQSTEALSAILVAGAGGAANSTKGLGGRGGDVSGLNQAKDVNSSINLIQAGNGGDNPLGKAGAGGSLLNLKTVGFIGRPSDGDSPLGVFDALPNPLGGPDMAIQQGAFSGRGGIGVTKGVNGVVSNVTARQIAAIAAAIDPITHHFAAASKVNNVKADLIGFDADRGMANPENGVYNDAAGTQLSPSGADAKDGFILSQTPLVNVTGQRTGFVFIEPA